MSDVVGVSRARFALRVALAGAAAGLLAGCSSSERLSEPFTNPFQTSSAAAPPEASAPAAPVAPVQSRPLAAPAASAPQPARAAGAPAPGGQSFAGWSAQGGTPIVVAQGESAALLSNRYGVPVEALVRANGLSSAAQIQPGTRLIIPVYNAALAAASGIKTISANPQASKASAPGKVPGAPPRTLAAQAASLKAAANAASKPAPKAAVLKAEPSRGQKIARMPAPAAQPQKTAAKAMPVPAPAPAKQEAVRTAKAEPAAAQKTEPSQAKAAEPIKASAAAAQVKPEFRWPARGRIIEAFRPGGNDGINIALPEGTSVKAAESGVVAYAGNELKGYGNLILIRHPNGFVSAYANTGEIQVKRGEAVKRGQVIAKSGQSGNVSTPQLHFELRKGTTPVDPTQYLAGV